MIALVTLTTRRQNLGEGPLLSVLVANHMITGGEAFREAVRSVMPYVSADKLVTSSIVPDQPETDYDYIRRGEASPINTDAVASEVT